MLRTLITATVVLVLSSLAPAQTALTAKWEGGDILRYVIEDTYISTSTVGARSFELRQSLTLDTTWEVERVPAQGGVVWNVEIDRVRYTADGKDAAALIQNLSFDSSEQAEPKSQPGQAVVGVLQAYVGPVGAVTVDRRGRVTEFSLSAELSEKLKDNTTRELAGFFGDLFTPDGVRHRLTNWIVAFPVEPVSKGETWSQKLPSRFGPKIVGIRNYELIGSVREDSGIFLRIDITPEFKVAGDSKSTFTGQEGDGVVHLDSETHQIRDFVLRQKGRIPSFSVQTFDITYSVKLQHPDLQGRTKR